MEHQITQEYDEINHHPDNVETPLENKSKNLIHLFYSNMNYFYFSFVFYFLTIQIIFHIHLIAFLKSYGL